jgi:hypothetical protein
MEYRNFGFHLLNLTDLNRTKPPIDKEKKKYQLPLSGFQELLSQKIEILDWHLNSRLRAMGIYEPSSSS